MVCKILCKQGVCCRFLGSCVSAGRMVGERAGGGALVKTRHHWVAVPIRAVAVFAAGNRIHTPVLGGIQALLAGFLWENS